MSFPCGNSYTNPSVTDFKNYFNRDFPYSNADLTTVQDADIQKALTQQQNLINPGLFYNQNVYTQGALLMAAHFMVLNLRASAQGIAGKFEWLQNSKTAGSVSVGISIPDRLLENPEFAVLVSTTYGTQFLYLVLPLLTGQMYSLYGPRPEGFNFFGGIYGSVGPWGSGGPGGC